MLSFEEVIEAFYNKNNMNKDYLLFNYLPESNYLNPSKQVKNLIIFIYSYYINFNIYLTESKIINLLCSYCASKTKSSISR